MKDKEKSKVQEKEKGPAIHHHTSVPVNFFSSYTILQFILIEKSVTILGWGQFLECRFRGLGWLFTRIVIFVAITSSVVFNLLRWISSWVRPVVELPVQLSRM